MQRSREWNSIFYLRANLIPKQQRFLDKSMFYAHSLVYFCHENGVKSNKIRIFSSYLSEKGHDLFLKASMEAIGVEMIREWITYLKNFENTRRSILLRF